MKQKIIDGVPYEISEPYSEGHICNSAEAAALNQVRAENIGNNLRAKLKELHEAGKSEEAKALVFDHDKSYVFNHVTLAQRAGRLDPVEREARATAKGIIKKHLSETGRKLDVPPDGESEDSWAEKIEAKITEVASRPEVIEFAKQTLQRKAAAAASVNI